LEYEAEQEFEEPTIFQEIGTLFLVIVLGVFVIITLLLLYPCQKYDKCSCWGIREYSYEKIKYNIFWNSTVRYLLESYIEVSLSSLSLLHFGEDIWSQEKFDESLFAIVALIILIVSPALVSLYLKAKIALFRDTEFLKSWKGVIVDLNPRYWQSSGFIALFCYRRLV
jgi:hypothetical protein